MPRLKILLVETDHRERSVLYKEMAGWGVQAVTARNGDEAAQRVTTDVFDLVISEFEVPGLGGIDFIRHIKSKHPDTKILCISRQASVEDAVAAMKAGALDFIVKPIEHTYLRFIVESAFKKNGVPENDRIRKERSVSICTQNRAMLDLLDLAKQVAGSTASILIQGESGTGKELFARVIHDSSPRRNRSFIAVNCAALPESLLESELFGHEKGAFTGAVSKKPGKFELADRGTILLDEITEMQLHLQSKLLRIIQEREVDRVGGLHPVKVDVRIIATSNRDVREAIKKGAFREDLYYRLNTIPLKIPPLRDRLDDVEPLVAYLIDKYNEIDARNVKSLTKGALNALQKLPFRGNVRELENIIQRAILLSDGQTIKEKDLFLGDGESPIPLAADNRGDVTVDAMTGPLKEVEKKMIFHTLGKTKGNRTHAAKILGISVRTLRNKLNEYRESMEVT